MLVLWLATLVTAAPLEVDVTAGTSLGRLHADHDLYDPVNGHFRKLQWLPGGHLRLGVSQEGRFGVALEVDGAAGRAGPETSALLYATRLDLSKPFPTELGPFAVVPEISAGLGIMGVSADPAANGTDLDPMLHWGVATTLWPHPQWGVRVDARHVIGHRRTRNAGPASQLIAHAGLTYRVTAQRQGESTDDSCRPLSETTPQVVAFDGCPRAVFEIDLTGNDGSALLGGTVRIPGGAIFRQGSRVVGSASRDVVLTSSDQNEWNLEVWTTNIEAPDRIGDAEWTLIEEADDGSVKWRLSPFTGTGPDSAIVGAGMSLFRNASGTWSLDPNDVPAQVPGAVTFLQGSSTLKTVDHGLWLERKGGSFELMAGGEAPPSVPGIEWTPLDGSESTDVSADAPSRWKGTATLSNIAMQLPDGRVLMMGSDDQWSVEPLNTLTGSVSWIDDRGQLHDLPEGARLERQADGSWKVVMEEEPPPDPNGAWKVENVDEDVFVVSFTGTQPKELRTSDGYVLRQDADGNWRLVVVDEDGNQGLVRIEEDGTWTLLMVDENGNWTVQVLDEGFDEDDLTTFTFLGAEGHEEVVFSFFGGANKTTTSLSLSPVPVYLSVSGPEAPNTPWSWRLDGEETTLSGTSQQQVVRELAPGSWRATVWGDGLATQSKEVRVPAQAERVDIDFEAAVPLVELRGDEIVALERLYFDVDEVVPTSIPLLQEVAATLLAHPELTRVEVQGHTDATGETEYNLQLSQSRVDAAVAMLVAFGVAKERLTPKGYGESQPLTDNRTEEGRATNRRVQFIVLERAEAEAP